MERFECQSRGAGQQSCSPNRGRPYSRWYRSGTRCRRTSGRLARFDSAQPHCQSRLNPTRDLIQFAELRQWHQLVRTLSFNSERCEADSGRLSSLPTNSLLGVKMGGPGGPSTCSADRGASPAARRSVWPTGRFAGLRQESRRRKESPPLEMGRAVPKALDGMEWWDHVGSWRPGRRW